MCVSTRQRIRRHADVEVVFIVPSLAQLLAAFGVPVIAEYFEAREELFELHLPIEEHTRRHNDEVWAPYTPVTGKMCQKCDRLDCFSIIEQLSA